MRPDGGKWEGTTYTCMEEGEKEERRKTQRGRGGEGEGFFCHYLNLGKKEIKHWGRRFMCLMLIKGIYCLSSVILANKQANDNF